jgi:hypothetical protein
MTSLNRWIIALLLASIFPCNAGRAEEHGTVLEAGAAGEWDVKNGGQQLGPTLGFEVTPVEQWLELEGDLTEFRNHGASAWETGLLLKKPYDLSEKSEFMVGVGPTWSHTNQQGQRADSFGVEFAADFMHWPGEGWGWYAEPTYGVGLGQAHSRSAGFSVGLIYAVP